MRSRSRSGRGEEGGRGAWKQEKQKHERGRSRRGGRGKEKGKER